MLQRFLMRNLVFGKRYPYYLLSLFFFVSVHVKARDITGEKKSPLTKDVYMFYTSLETSSPDLDKIQDEIAHLQRKKNRFKDEVRFIEFAFYRIHRRFLKNYQLFSTLPQLLNDGKYDCVSGTALYALIFKFLGIKYEIRETAYHVYLLAYTSNHQLIVIESTDPFYGCIVKLDRIKQYAAQMRMKQLAATNSQYYQYQHFIDNAVSLRQLVGLQFFNMAIQFYNQTHIEKAKKYLALAFYYYESERMYEFKNLMELYSHG